MRTTEHCRTFMLLIYCLALGACSSTSEADLHDGGVDAEVDLVQPQEAAIDRGDRGVKMPLDAPDEALVPDFSELVPNSGQPCTPYSTCPHPGDICLPFASLDEKIWSCTGVCPELTEPCSVPDPSTQLSACMKKWGDDFGNEGNACLWFCEAENETFACPNDTDFSCEVWNPEFPGYKFCRPL